ncbi:uncharacterized protein ARMOST_06215 [Armillaria ostoyae]|uniref:Uncharacterized protein n=1 Tax=Armillaria ostoyae TaxID=47428 RepID=A0A284R2B1_ARMOS|nr:uncharacterized protein ARMOST_06215 [Armillaria ostoyae]
MAITYGSIDSVEVLVDAGCDISPRSKGKTPLDLALNQQSSDLVQYLLDKGASFDQCLPHSFEDLSWASRELWYQKAQEHLAELQSGPNSQQDSDNNEVAHLLMAGLWTVTSAERHELVKITEDSPREPYISTTLPITGSPENPVRQIVFTTVSHDQGWSSDDTHGGGMHAGSFTWFEAGVESSPGVFMRIQDNVRADSQYRTHVNVWDHQDAPLPIKEWMANIKVGDTISVYPRARFAAWVNYVQSVKIDVYTACA